MPVDGPVSPGASEPVLMRQVLDRETRQPKGPATVFSRFEGRDFGGAITNPIAVARDQIVLTLAEPASDLWSIDLPAK